MAALRRPLSVERLDARAFRIPTDAPEADGTLDWEVTVLVVVDLSAGGVTGLGYTYTHPAAIAVIRDALQPLVMGSDPFAARQTWQAMRDRVRNIGNRGIAAAALSAVDVALWDLAARRLDLPLRQMLGGGQERVQVYGSGGFTAYDDARLDAQLAQWAGQDFPAVKMKIGTRPAEDVARVQKARGAIGPQTRLMVDANGAYTPKQALGVAEAIAAEGVIWFEEPVSSDDIAGLARLCQRGPAGMDITAGEYGWEPHHFRRLLEARAVDVLQADATRCGGVTGYMLADALCDAFAAPLSAHCAPALHAVLGCAGTQTRHIEYFHDHSRIEQRLFDGAPTPRDGWIADSGAPGLGLTFKDADAAPFAL